MALSAFERQVLLLNLQLKMVPKEAPSLTVMQFFGVVQRIHAAGQAGMFVGDQVDENAEETEATDDNLLTIEDYRQGKDGTQTFLFHHGDARAADPRFKNRTTAVVRPAGKLPDETVSHAAHLVLSAPPGTAKPPNTIRAVLERVPGLGRASILAYLNRLVRLSFAESDYRFTAENGKRPRCHPRLESSQPASANIKEDLAAGRLSRIEFIRTEGIQGLDEEGVVRPVSIRLVHEVERGLKKSRNLSLFKQAKQKARNLGYEDIQVRFTREGVNRQFSPRFSTAQDDAEDTLYSCSHTVNDFKMPLDPCPERVNDELLTKMHALLINDKLWR